MKKMQKIKNKKLKQIGGLIKKSSDKKEVIELAQDSATNKLIKKYRLNIKKIKELKKFIKEQKKEGTSINKITGDLINEGWKKEVIKPFVKAHYNEQNVKSKIPRKIDWYFLITLLVMFAIAETAVIVIYSGGLSSEPIAGLAARTDKEQILQPVEIVLNQEEFKEGEFLIASIKSDYIYRYVHISSADGRMMEVSFLEAGEWEWIRKKATMKILITGRFSGGLNKLIVLTCKHFSENKCLEKKLIYKEFVVDKERKISKGLGEMNLSEKIELSKSYSGGGGSAGGNAGSGPPPVVDTSITPTGSYCYEEYTHNQSYAWRVDFEDLDEDGLTQGWTIPGKYTTNSNAVMPNFTIDSTEFRSGSYSLREL